jgi:5'-nucleotidase / UDP-sugar diphosphatase
VGMAPAEKLDGFVSLDPVPVVQKMVNEIDLQTDLIVVLSHLGIDNDRELAQSVKGVDLIIGGHSHSRLEVPERDNGVLIVQTGSNCRNLGRIDLTIAGDSIMAYDGKLIPLFTKDINPDPSLAAFADTFKTEIDKEYAVVIAQLKQPWETQYRAESNIGDWLTEAMRNHLRTDVAFLNSGGIRKNLEAGPVRKKDIFEILPFDNKLVTFTLTGAELLRIAEKNVGLESNSYQGSLQIAGLTYCWSGDSTSFKVVDARVNGVPLEPTKTYNVGSIDYVAHSNADKYFGFEPQHLHDTEEGLTQAVLDEVTRAGVIDSKIEGRIKKVQ